MNTQALLEVKEQILAHPELHDMSDYFRESDCDTQMCIAGQLVWNAGWRPLDDLWIEHEYDREPRRILVVAAEILQVNYWDAQELFFEDSWPAQFRDLFMKAETSEGRARAAAAMIDYFIVTHQRAPKPSLVVEDEACRLVADWLKSDVDQRGKKEYGL